MGNFWFRNCWECFDVIKTSISVAQDGRKAHVGIHHCDGGPEPAHHSRALMQVEGMPLNEAEPCPGDSTPGGEGGSAARGEGGTSSTDGESDTCVDEGTLCASASR